MYLYFLDWISSYSVCYFSKLIKILEEQLINASKYKERNEIKYFLINS